MYNPEIPPPTTTTSQDNGLKNDFSSSGRKIKKRLSLKESVIGYRKVVNVRFSSRRGEEKGAVGGGGEGSNSTKYSVFAGRLCPEFQTLSLYKPFLTKKAPLSYTFQLKIVPFSLTCFRTVHTFFNVNNIR